MHHTSDTTIAGDPQLAVWEFAGLLLTYWCNARCAICYLHSGPEHGGVLDVDTAVALWRSLDEHAAAHGKTMRIHLAGGEPFRDWEHLVAVITAARAAGLTPLEKVETNAFWATDDELTRARLTRLDALGMQKLVVSTDVFHQEFVPFDRVRRCVELARAVLGPGRVQVRWWDFYNSPIDIRRLRPADRAAAYRAALARHRDRLTGRAADVLAPLLPGRPAAAFAGENCAAALLGSRHVHIDPAGHIFPGTCIGIILGRAGPRSVAQLWHALGADWRSNPILTALVTGGSVALLDLARQHGYQERPDGYADKCHLCSDARAYLAARGLWPEFVGPPGVYASRP